MTTRVQVVFYSMYARVYRLAEAVSAGAREVAGTEVSVYQVPELVPDDILEKSGAKAARTAFPMCRLQSPRSLRMRMRSFSVRRRASATCAHRCATCGLWISGALVGKV